MQIDDHKPQEQERRRSKELEFQRPPSPRPVKVVRMQEPFRYIPPKVAQPRFSKFTMQRTYRYTRSCRFCGDPNHWQNVCPHKQPKVSRFNPHGFPKGSCYECGSRDHLRGNCPVSHPGRTSEGQPRPKVTAAFKVTHTFISQYIIDSYAHIEY